MAKERPQRTARRGEPGDPCIMVIFGASGDLTKRKLLPALYNLGKSKLLPSGFALVGFARSEMTREAFQALVADALRTHAARDVDPEMVDFLVQRSYVVCGDYADPDAYKRLQSELATIDETHGTRGNYLYYLATPPKIFDVASERLGAVGLTVEQGAWRRVIVEKPFGHDLTSARELNRALVRTLGEQQIYRIDHYLGKETVQNILVLRFANGIFEPLWNRQYIDHVQITVAESVGLEGRAGYYESSGAVRDMLQNHLFQLLSLIAMEPPLSISGDSVRDEKAKVLSGVVPFTPEDVLTHAVRGQYGEGIVNGKAGPAYRSEKGASPTSSTETYVAIRLMIDSWRWAGVPFYLRTGKRMATRITEIAVQFKAAPHVMFRGTETEHPPPNWLALHLQPREGISISFQAKVPGPVVRTGEVEMDFDYSEYFGADPTTGYETLLYDCMCGDQTLFQRADSVEAGWNIVTPVLDLWSALPARNFPNYAAGSWGPREADELLERDGHAWRKVAP